ncbi:MAG: hypothetical protein M0P94_04215, partial [Candidatus Absconditabacterales bacterium]|nr:hypothetical protein [Candidatus Absconditabacterales bacterium]
HTGLAMQGLTPLKKLIISLSSSQCVKLSMQQYIEHFFRNYSKIIDIIKKERSTKKLVIIFLFF